LGSISRPAQAAVVASIAETIFIITVLSISVVVALRSALIGQASAGSIRGAPLLDVTERIGHMAVVAVLTTKRTVLGGRAPISILVDSVVDRYGRFRSRRLRSGGMAGSREGKILKTTDGCGCTTLTGA